MTKTIIWSPVTAYYDNLPLPGSGVMKANAPWSGHFEVQPALWATAHTTQFAEPGWRYLDAGCGLLPGGGSYVTLLSPDGTDYSIIVETVDAPVPQAVVFELDPALASGPLRVWRSDANEMFAQLPDVVPEAGRLAMRFQGGSIYSLTTTTGQTHGAYEPPAPAPFPLPYVEDFESTRRGATPRFFSDQAGVFEVVKKRDGRGQALRQVIDRKGIEWHFHWNPHPETFLGDVGWKDYSVSVDALLEQQGFVSLFGRVGTVPQNENLPAAYWLKVSDAGYWELGNARVPLASGRCGFRPGRWHNLRLSFRGEMIRVAIDAREVAVVQNAEHAAGMVGVGSGWHGAQFDNLRIEP